ncbi:type II toxin-antitoxin system RelE/ParE family toxin [Phenylobacterium sp.]|uniref:type II toxin-antitoxin system RelE/ParE family toxin n=1 Tax=Phenylobacterium sp. TaxID=1871053 RepID=UPI0030F3ABC3
MSIYKTKAFARFALKAGLADAQLAEAAAQVVNDRFGVDLGGGVYKQRVARAGGGKSGGYRTLIAFRVGASCFFVYGFAKNEMANVTKKALEALQSYATLLLSYDEHERAQAVAQGELVELEVDGDKGSQS